MTDQIEGAHPSGTRYAKPQGERKQYLRCRDQSTMRSTTGGSADSQYAAQDRKLSSDRSVEAQSGVPHSSDHKGGQRPWKRSARSPTTAVRTARSRTCGSVRSYPQVIPASAAAPAPAVAADKRWRRPRMDFHPSGVAPFARLLLPLRWPQHSSSES